MDLWELEAREAIRDLVARYNANGDTGRFDQVMELFAPDAVMTIGEQPPYVGAEAIRSIFTGTRDRHADRQREGPGYLRHMTSTLQIDVIDRATANGRCYFAVLTAVGLDHWGRYVDRYRTVDGVWKFADRRVTTDGYSAGSLFR